MTKELQDKIYHRFPNWFRLDKSAYDGGFGGFSHGDGWFDLIWELLEKLEPAVEANFQVVQVKEKFGTLRFYYEGSHVGRLYELVREAEEKSGVTCETCGQEGTLRGGGWLRTLCQTHHEERDIERGKRLLNQL